MGYRTTRFTKGGGLPRDTSRGFSEQSDCSAQLLRLLIICRSQLRKSRSGYKLNDVIEKLHSRLLEFYIPVGEDRGGMRYQLSLDSVCSWCTMFSMQALRLWSVTNSKNMEWIDYFI